MRRSEPIVGGKQIFDAMLARVLERSKKERTPDFKAFPLWFIPIYYPAPSDISVTDGCRDGRVDASFRIIDGGNQFRILINSKFTRTYNKLAPVQFYNEISRYAEAFEKKRTREQFLDKAIRPQLHDQFLRFFEEYDDKRLRMLFLTDYRRNEAQMWSVGDLECFHFEDIASYVINDLESLIPRTKDLILRNVSPPLSAAEGDSDVPITVTFARVIDFISYMKDDPLDLFFQRNVRLDLGNTTPNRDIKATFKDQPSEFIFSNNGITILVDDSPYDPPSHTLRLTNPRVVNGSQTLHQVRAVRDPSHSARVMVRVIKVPFAQGRLRNVLKKRKEIVEAISFRSNLQNPIEPWDLCANDENQVDIQKYFLKKALYYETRRREWSVRKASLPGIMLATDVKTMGQLLASSHWSTKAPLGPFVAKTKVRLLFDRAKDGGYKYIRRLGAVEAYNLYRVHNALDTIVFPKKLRPMKRHASISLFALVCKAIERANHDLKDERLTPALETLGGSRSFKSVGLKLATLIYQVYKEANRAFRRDRSENLPYNTFFKQEGYVIKLSKLPLPNQTMNTFRKCLDTGAGLGPASHG